MVIQKSLNNQSNLEKEEKSWSYHTAGIEIIPQSYSNISNMVPAQKLFNGTE